MITNRIRMEYVGHVGGYDIHLLMAKGLKRLLATNTDDGNVVCPEVLIERKDLGSEDYKICTDIFQNIWTSAGMSTKFKINAIEWRHYGSEPDEITIKSFVNRFGLNDLFDFDEAHPEKNFGERTSVSILFITRFNLDETAFLADLPDEAEDTNE